MVGTQIAALRRGAGLTQAELARNIHVSPSAIGMYEQGRRLPAAPILVALSRVFDVSLDYLITGVPCIQKDVAPKRFCNKWLRLMASLSLPAAG